MNGPQSRVYDLPLRLFHWSFATLFLVAFIIAKTVDDESIIFTLHMLSGLIMIFLIFLRVIWGIVGTRYSRFSSFRLRPSEFYTYFTSIINSKTKRYLGHNPASSYVSMAMFIFTVGLGVSGILMSQRINKHFFEEIHEICANGFLVTVILHISGVVLHQVKHNDGMLLSMVTGKKESLKDKVEIESNRPLVAIFFIVLVVGFGLYLKNNFDTQSGQLNLFGYSIQLGEKEDNE